MSGPQQDEFGVEPIYMHHGGSIPVASLFARILLLPVILMGFGLPDDTIHAPSEKCNLDQFRMRMVTGKGNDLVSALVEKTRMRPSSSPLCHVYSELHHSSFLSVDNNQLTILY
jgi:hypothetical protein